MRARITEKGGGKAKKGKKVRTWTWSDVMKGLKIVNELETAKSDKEDEELETTNLVKCQSNSEVANSIEMFDSEEPNKLTKRTRGHWKSTPTWTN